MSEFYCYMLECADGTIYIGWTKDPQRRLHEHNAGRGGRYTRNRRPLRLVFLEPHPTRKEAMRREKALKRLSRGRKIALIAERPYEHGC